MIGGRRGQYRAIGRERLVIDTALLEKAAEKQRLAAEQKQRMADVRVRYQYSICLCLYTLTSASTTSVPRSYLYIPGSLLLLRFIYHHQVLQRAARDDKRAAARADSRLQDR